jgi:hypothetical protein
MKASVKLRLLYNDQEMSPKVLQFRGMMLTSAFPAFGTFSRPQKISYNVIEHFQSFLVNIMFTMFASYGRSSEKNVHQR